MDRKYIGYWRTFALHECNPSCKCRNYPIPQPHDTILDQADIICDAHYTLHHYRHKVVHCNGYSQCRICNIQNDDREYEIEYNNTIYVIPFGYFHYLEEHNVKIDDQLVAIVNYYENIYDNID